MHASNPALTPAICVRTRSHLYYGVQLVQLLVLLAVVSTHEYVSSTWGAWMVCCSCQLLDPVCHCCPTQCELHPQDCVRPRPPH